MLAGGHLDVLAAQLAVDEDARSRRPDVDVERDPPGAGQLGACLLQLRRDGLVGHQTLLRIEPHREREQIARRLVVAAHVGRGRIAEDRFGVLARPHRGQALFEFLHGGLILRGCFRPTLGGGRVVRFLQQIAAGVGVLRLLGGRLDAQRAAQIDDLVHRRVLQDAFERLRHARGWRARPFVHRDEERLRAVARPVVFARVLRFGAVGPRAHRHAGPLFARFGAFGSLLRERGQRAKQGDAEEEAHDSGILSAKAGQGPSPRRRTRVMRRAFEDRQIRWIRAHLAEDA